MGAVIQAKNAALKERRDVVMGFAVVLDAAQQALHVAMAIVVTLAEHAVVTLAAWQEPPVAEVLTAALRVRRAILRVVYVTIQY